MMVGEKVADIGPWIGAGLIIGGLAAWSGSMAGSEQGAALIQLGAVSLFGGALALCAYVDGLTPTASWVQRLAGTPPTELLKYWWWPGLAFASTYYLVVAGGVIFLLREPGIPAGYAVAGGGLVAGMMALYGYYLGSRRYIEEQQGQSRSSGLLRCPFVMGILSKSPSATAAMSAAQGSKI
jgi:hypothetical protein